MTFRSVVSLALFATLALTSAFAQDANQPATAMDRDHDEQVRVAIGAHSHLNDATALANKNTVLHGNNVDITRSNVLAQKNDRVMIETEQMTEDPASDAVMPSGMSLTGERDPLARPMTSEDEPKDDQVQDQNKEDMDQDQDDMDDEDHEQLVARRRSFGYRHRFFNPRFRGGYYGWRYPLSYWNRFGRRFYPGRCAFNRVHGGFFYC
ncbi:hypothetical protein Poli38472_006532 [Pythium oligandrum]|uniref:Uncharacterized protein n=1 Tax=Pythium oligandrum TaxID=41045 RepID=A0A8K1FED9_PYTOL|nr:hypothetical protein Poli38472_006532 [Pythium oligandrum]|eukprot:TMW56522.1 hypothetical protein Poli38472_006532 [Pythium oligandrum]